MKTKQAGTDELKIIKMKVQSSVSKEKIKLVIFSLFYSQKIYLK